MVCTFQREDQKRDLQLAVGIVNEMRHGDEGMSESVRWQDTLLLVQRQHSFQQVDKLSPVQPFRHQLAALEICWHVDLRHVIKTVEDVLTRLLRLDVCL